MKKNFFPFGFFLLLFYLCSCNNNNTADKQTEAAAKPELKSIFINGDSIHYIDIGKGEPVVFVHGAFGSYRTFEGQFDSFSQNHRVISYSKRLNYPNNQVANDSTNTSDSAHSKDLADFIKALNLGPVHLVGHSGGALIALLTTLEHPELVQTLTLGEAPVVSLLKNVPHGDSVLSNFFATTIKPATDAFKNNDDAKAVSVFVNGVMGDSSYFNNRSPQFRETMLTNTAEVKHNLLHGRVSPNITCDDLKKIKIPTLLIQGEKSIAFFTLINDELYRCLTNREKAILKNAAHGLEYENPTDFNKIVLGFIDKH